MNSLQRPSGHHGGTRPFLGSSLLLAILLVAAGCGGDKGAGDTTIPFDVETTTTEMVTTTTELVTTTTIPVATTTAAPVTTAAPPPAVDLTAKARAAVLQAGDFPPGFAPIPESDGGGLGIEVVWSEILACVGLPPAKTSGIATSPTFKRGLATQARTTVDYTTPEAAAAISAALAGPKFLGCAKNAFAAESKRKAPEGSVPGPPEIVPVNPPPVAPKISAYRINITIGLDELQVPLAQDFLVIFHKGAVIRALFLNNGSEFPQELERSLLEKVVSRV